MNVPKLRFRGFNGEWEEKKLGDIGENIIGITYSPKNVTTEEDYPIVFRSSNIKNGSLDFGDLVRVKEKIPEKLYVKPKDILICTRNGSQRLVGKNTVVGELKQPATFGAFMSVFRSSNNDFIEHLLETDTYKRQIHMNLGARINQITTGYLNKFKFYFPKKEEQEKIAGFLGVVDNKISGLEKKKELLEKYKKGVMQKIFTQQIRFKGFSYKWQEKTLEEITERVTNKNRNNAIDYVLTNSATEGIVSQIEYFEKDIANKGNLTNYYVVSTDDFVYNPRISSSAPVGPIKRNRLGKGVMSPLYSVFRFKKGFIDFFEHYFETTYWHEYLKSVANFGARHDRMNITTVDFYDLPLPFPSIEEQKAIADFLTAIDDKIELENKKLQQAKLFKKSLLQKMFV